MKKYTDADYRIDFRGYLDRLTPEEEAERGWRGGVFVGLLTKGEWERRDAELREIYGRGMDSANYGEYLMRCRMNRENTRREKKEHQKSLGRFFYAEREGLPHAGATDESLDF